MGTVSTACQTLQATLKSIWATGSTYAEMTMFLGVSRDQITRLRDRLGLPVRHDRSKRKKGPRHGDPTPKEIAARAAEMRAKHMASRLAEPPKTYRTFTEMVLFRVERSHELKNDLLEELLDNFGDP
jgi:hypothetical protein